MKNFNITIGSDPEVFVQNAQGEVVTAEGIVPGTKKAPHPITDEGHAIQLDNVAMEYNIPPCKTRDEFVQHIHFVKDYLEMLASEHGLSLSPLASYELDPKYLQTENAKTFGCEPDFNAYREEVNPRPEAVSLNLRSAGGHIAIGYPNYDFDISIEIVKAFDLFVVLPALLIDKDTRRRELYGKAGSFRFTNFGVECRSLSNFWINSKELTAWVYDQTIKATECVLSGEWNELKAQYPNVEEIINTGNVEKAKEVVKELQLDLITI